MRVNSVYEFVERKVGNAFAKYGRFVSRHAWKILIIAVIVNGALGVGMMKLKNNIDAENVYLPQGTQSRKDQDKVESIFPDLSGSNYNGLQLSTMGAWAKVIVKSKTGSLLNRTVLEEVETLNNIVEAVTTTADDGSVITFARICAITASSCLVDGELFWSTEFLAAVDSGQVTYPLFSYSKGTTNYASDIGGRIQEDGTYLQGMEFIRLSYVIRTDESQYKDLATLWVDAFKEKMDTYTSSNFEIAYAHFKSLDEELDQNVSGDISLFSITMTLMITYSCIATLTARITNQVAQRMWLGFGGMIAAGLAVVSGFGFVAAIGVEFVSIVGVVPFLIIGIGIDDMFILLSGLSGAQTQKAVEDKMAETLRTSGVGITITSLTDFIAFMAGAGSSFIAVKNFCIYTGVAVVFCYINNLTFFAACLAINERRVADNRHYGTCRPIKTKERLREEGRSNCFIACCGGRPPTSRNEAESWVDKLPRWLLPKIVLKTPFKIIIVFLFMGYLAASIYGCVNMKQGLQFTQLVSDDSYYYKYATWEENHFKRTTPVSFVIDSTYTYSDISTQSLIEDLITGAQVNPYFDDEFEVNWLKVYKATGYYNDTNETSFISGFRDFIAAPQYAMYENDVKIDVTNSFIKASRVYILSKDMPDSQKEGKMMLEARAYAKSARIECFAYYPAFVAYEQYVAILGQTLQSVGIALAAVFVITCIFMPHPILIIFTTVAVTMIMVGVFGFLFFLDVALSAITMIHLIMSIGFSIDFTAHICHGYMISNGESRDIKVRGAIDKTGAPIFHGAVSSILGIIVLVGAKSYIFRTFAAVMSLVLVFGIAHALLLLPVVLSWIGPGRNKTNSNGTQQDKKHNTKHNTNGPISPEKELHENGNSNGVFVNDNGTGSSADLEAGAKHIDYMMKFDEKAKHFNLQNGGGKSDRWSWTEAKES